MPLRAPVISQAICCASCTTPKDRGRAGDMLYLCYQSSSQKRPDWMVEAERAEMQGSRLSEAWFARRWRFVLVA